MLCKGALLCRVWLRLPDLPCIALTKRQALKRLALLGIPALLCLSQAPCHILSRVGALTCHALPGLGALLCFALSTRPAQSCLDALSSLALLRRPVLPRLAYAA
jgi:hypothetical protein